MILREVLWYLFLFFSSLAGSSTIPRISVPHQDVALSLFREEGIYNHTTFLLREDLGVLILGARDAIYALDLNDISRKRAELPWKVTEGERRQCSDKGKHFENECRNYIRVLQKADDDRMYVCGTNAFSPTCAYMTYSDGQLKLEEKRDKGKGKCPFDPSQRHSSVILDGDLYSAISLNFLGYDLALTRMPLRTLSTKPTLRTYESKYTLNEPIFVHMDVVRESQGSSEGDDDKVYMFFTEKAVEYDFPGELMVSRVARVCKGDLGGHRLLSKRWTTFLKARLDCPGPEPSLPYIIQNVFQLQNSDWRKSIFYVVFTAQGSSDLSVVCAYSVTAIQDVFSKGRYKMPIKDTYPAKWATYYGEIPDPRPGAGITEAVRMQGIRSSLDLPDKTLQFVRDRPLMDKAVQPINGAPRLLKRGPMFTCIVVDRVAALDGHSYDVMFIGTANGFVQKAVNYDGEMFIIEEVQLLPVPEPIKTLRISSITGSLYAGSETAAVQMPVSECGRSSSCQDCVLARDPYCAWDATTHLCVAVSGLDSTSDRNLIQSLKDADTSMCPSSGSVEPQSHTLIPGNNILLQCKADSNLAQVLWFLDDQPLDRSSSKYFFYHQGLMIRDASTADYGRYTCQSAEWCINNATRKQGIRSSMDLPDKTLQFVRDRPLMDEAVRPLSGRPQLLKRGPMFTRIVVDRVAALDGHSYDVMFIGTENGFVQKAVNYDGEMFIIEEVQLLPVPEPIKTLRISRVMGRLYAGSETAAVQMPVSECGRSSSCLDCVLARDPYCAWDATTHLCVAVSGLDSTSDRTLIQSLRDGSESLCPDSGSVEPQSHMLIPGNNILLQCKPDSNLAQVLWFLDDQPLDRSSSKYFFYHQGLMIRDASTADSGRYTCQSAEWVRGRQHSRTVAVYQLQPGGGDPNLPSTEAPPSDTPSTKMSPTEPAIEISTITPELLGEQSNFLSQSRSEQGKIIALQVSVALLSLLLVALVTWNVCQGHFPVLGRYGPKPLGVSGVRQTQSPPPDFTCHQVPFQTKVAAERKLLVTPVHCNPGNNQSRDELSPNHSLSPRVVSSMDVFKFINDESEI